MQATQVTQSQSQAMPLAPYEAVEAADSKGAARTYLGMILEFVSLLKELRKTLDQVEADLKGVSLELLESFKEQQETMRDKRKEAQWKQGTGQLWSGILGLGGAVAGFGLGFVPGSNGVGMTIDTVAHVSGPAGNITSADFTRRASEDNYKADEAQTFSELAKEAMHTSDGSAGKVGDESHRVRDEYLSQMRALIQEWVAAMKASVR